MTVRYTLKQGTETIYNGTSRTDSYNVAKRLGFVRIAGKPPTAGCLIEEVGTLNGTQTYFWHKRT